MVDLDALDRADPLRAFRERFTVPKDVVYLDGNSLGCLPRATSARVAEVVEREWGDGLIRSWNQAGWIDLPRRVGDKIARLIGARAGEVVVADVAALLGAELRRVAGDAVLDAIDDRVAVTSLTHVSYRTGRMHDLARLIERAREAGALSLWDLAHSAGAMPIDLNGAAPTSRWGAGTST